MHKFLYKYCFILLIFTVSCGSGDQKEIEADYKEINDVMDTIVAKVNFNPISTKDIYLSMAGIIEGTPKLSMPKSFITDSSQVQNYIQEAGIAQVYNDWSGFLKMKTVNKNSAYRLKNSTNMLWSTTLENQGKQSNDKKDSLDLTAFFAHGNHENYKVYFQAVSWLENLYFSIQLNENISQKTKYNQLLMKQLKKGNDLLTYLYDYQDYRPISIFSQNMLDVVDCKNFEMNVTQLKEVVIDCRKRIYYIE